MISNIAHQWRQPLSELSSIFMFIKFKYSINALDIETMDKKSKEADKVLEYMSHTIDDFRNFFMPKKEKEEFYLLKAVEIVMNIISSTLANYNIKIEIDIDEKINRLPISYFDRNQQGNILSRITNDVDTISNALQQSLIQVVTSILGIILSLIMMLILINFYHSIITYDRIKR